VINGVKSSLSNQNLVMLVLQVVIGIVGLRMASDTSHSFSRFFQHRLFGSRASRSMTP
jgi:hypothetical protein